MVTLIFLLTNLYLIMINKSCRVLNYIKLDELYRLQPNNIVVIEKEKKRNSIFNIQFITVNWQAKRTLYIRPTSTQTTVYGRSIFNKQVEGECVINQGAILGRRFAPTTYSLWSRHNYYIIIHKLSNYRLRLYNPLHRPTKV